MDRISTMIGLQLSQSGAQITWIHDGLQEPQTLSLPGEKEDGCMEVPPAVWRQVCGQDSLKDTEDSLSSYLLSLLNMIPGRTDFRRCAVCVTLPLLTAQMSGSLTRALASAGFEEHSVYFQDWRTSFYYYAVNKKRELWNGDVAFLMHRDGKIQGSILHIDRSRHPAVASITAAGEADVSAQVRAGRSEEDWDRERDRLFFELLGRMFERRTVSASYLYGSWFSGTWAKRSFQYLTYHRHAFQGQNLFSKGACYGAMAREGKITMPDIVFMGIDMVTENWEMTANVRGKLKYVPLIEAGVNWYEAHAEKEFVVDSRLCASLLSQGVGQDQAVEHVIRLDHFPRRPDRASRVRLSVWFSAPDRLEAQIRDMGFGSMYPSSGKVWRRTILLPETGENGAEGKAEDGEGSQMR